MIQVAGPGSWRFNLDAEFQLIDNGDSVQAVAGDRVVYVSAMRVGAVAEVPSAAQLRMTASRTLRSSERMSHAAGGVEGEAEVRREADSFALHGFMCAPGAIATCVISFRRPGQAEWAESLWRSLTRSAS